MTNGGYLIPADFAFLIRLIVRRGIIDQTHGWRGLRKPDEI